MPGFPAPHLVLVQPEPTFGLLEARLNPPAAARHANQLFERCPLRGEHHIVGELSSVFQAATHEQQVLEALLFFGNLQPEQWQERPVVEARTFRAPSPAERRSHSPALARSASTSARTCPGPRSVSAHNGSLLFTANTKGRAPAARGTFSVSGHRRKWCLRSPMQPGA